MTIITDNCTESVCCIFPRVAEYDIVLTTYALIGREVGVPESMKKDKLAQDRPAEDVVSMGKMMILMA